MAVRHKVPAPIGDGTFKTRGGKGWEPTVADVFISYKTERRNAAQHLSRILELNGYSVWFDYGLLSGTDFGPQIERELRAAKAVVVLWCRLSHDSRWVLEEAHLADRLGTLTPVWLEPVELPLGFGRADTIDLSNWDGSPRSPTLDRLLNEIGRRVGRDPQPSYRGLQSYEEMWRGFGAPPLSRFALVDPIEEEARAFGTQPTDTVPAAGRPRARLTPGTTDAAPEAERPSAGIPAPPVPVTPAPNSRLWLVLAAAIIAGGGAGVWYWMTPKTLAPSPAAKTAAAPARQPAPAPPPTTAQTASAPPSGAVAQHVKEVLDQMRRPLPFAAPAPQSAPQTASLPPSTAAPVMPEPPKPAAAQPVNAPLATFVRSNSGWSVTLSFIEPVTAIAWRLGDSGPFKETGFLDSLDPRTRRRLANPSFALDPDQPAATIEVRAVDMDGNTAGLFPIAFDPIAELVRDDRRTLEMTAGSWLAFGNANGLLVYYTQLMTYRCAIREVRIGIDSTVPNKPVPLGACDPKHPYEIPANARPYLKLPPSTQMVSVELTYRDGSVSETKTFKR